MGAVVLNESAVYLLLSKRGTVCGVFASEAGANSARERYISDPNIDVTGEDSPYSIEPWLVLGAKRLEP